MAETKAEEAKRLKAEQASADLDAKQAGEQTTVNGLSDEDQQKRNEDAAKAEEARAKAAAEPVDEDAEDGEFGGQVHQSEHYIVTTDDHFGVGVVTVGKVGGVLDQFQIPFSQLDEFTAQLGKVKKVKAAKK